jgi:hypothetical protein
MRRTAFGAYALDGDTVILIDMLEIRHHDLRGIPFLPGFHLLALAEHYHILNKFRHISQGSVWDFFERFKRVVKSNINDMISKAENPEKMLNQLIIE